MQKHAQTCTYLKESCKQWQRYLHTTSSGYFSSNLIYAHFPALTAFSCYPSPCCHPSVDSPSLSCALLGPVMCSYVNDRHISDWLYGCNYKEFMISALTCFHLLYSQLYSIYIPCAYQVAVPAESVTNWKQKEKNSYLKSADFSCSELHLTDIVDRY